MSLQGKPFAIGEIVTIAITSLADNAEQIGVRCQVVAISTTTTHLEFTAVTMPLLTYIVQHIGTELGVAPYYFGKRPDVSAVA